jgi:hypothetical protein
LKCFFNFCFLCFGSEDEREFGKEMETEMAVLIRGNVACWVKFPFRSIYCFVDFGAVPVYSGPDLYRSLGEDYDSKL